MPIQSVQLKHVEGWRNDSVYTSVELQLTVLKGHIHNTLKNLLPIAHFSAINQPISDNLLPIDSNLIMLSSLGLIVFT